MIWMRSIRLLLLACITILIAGSGLGETEYTRDRYDLIVERSPFGEDPTLADQAEEDRKKQLEAQKLAQQLEKQIRLCFLLETDEGDVRAGFQNLKAQAGDPKSVMLMVGESFQGMKLLDIDLIDSTATLQHMGKPVTFELTKAPATQPKKPATPKNTPQRRFGGGFRPQPPKQPQQPPEPQLSPEEQARKRQEVRENLQQYQMEVIRAGMPPLPIPLTQEMDDQLVAEGVLPPSQE